MLEFILIIDKPTTIGGSSPEENKGVLVVIIPKVINGTIDIAPSEVLNPIIVDVSPIAVDALEALDAILVDEFVMWLMVSVGSFAVWSMVILILNKVIQGLVEGSKHFKK